jgi:hypothetical protein
MLFTTGSAIDYWIVEFQYHGMNYRITNTCENTGLPKTFKQKNPVIQYTYVLSCFMESQNNQPHETYWITEHQSYGVNYRITNRCRKIE